MYAIINFRLFIARLSDQICSKCLCISPILIYTMGGRHQHLYALLSPSKASKNPKFCLTFQNVSEIVIFEPMCSNFEQLANPEF